MTRIISILALLSIVSYPATAHAEKRIALVVTNQQYPSTIGRLANTYENGKVLTQALKRIGFDVHTAHDVDKTKLVAVVSAHATRIKLAGSDTIGFFYFSGHGTAQKTHGDNFLIPIGAAIKYTLSFR